MVRIPTRLDSPLPKRLTSEDCNPAIFHTPLIKYHTMDSGSSSAAKVTLFEDIFEITALNPDGYKFDRVNRIQATGTTFECELLLDINCEIYNTLFEQDKFTLVLASTLHLDGSPADHFNYTPQHTVGTSSGSSSAEPSLADNYEYVMHGRVFDIEHRKDGSLVIAISYGGLLMRLIGDQRHLTAIQNDQRLYLLVKKD